MRNIRENPLPIPKWPFSLPLILLNLELNHFIMPNLLHVGSIWIALLPSIGNSEWPCHRSFIHLPFLLPLFSMVNHGAQFVQALETNSPTPLCQNICWTLDWTTLSCQSCSLLGSYAILFSIAIKRLIKFLSFEPDLPWSARPRFRFRV